MITVCDGVNADLRREEVDKAEAEQLNAVHEGEHPGLGVVYCQL